MCGITGVVLLDKNFQENLKQVMPMTKVINHRGPDGEGYYFSEHVAFGHRRLKIIDLSENASQPIYNEKRDIVLVFNGEIYNFRELRKDLIGKGHNFISDTDSEVIVHLYEEYGTFCTSLLEGMFAFAIHDKRKNRVFIARDRLGEKPLFTYQNNTGIYFSSEIKSFFQIKGFKKELSIPGIRAFFDYIQIPEPLTIYKNVKKLRPGSWLMIESNGSILNEQYWKIDCTNKFKGSFREAKEYLNFLLVDSVSKMTVSDVPLGILLSGGVDSSLVASIAKRNSKIDFEGFTVTNDENNIKDLEKIRALNIAKSLGIKSNVFNFGASRVDKLIYSVKMCDEPIGLLEIYYMFGIFEVLPKNIKVILTGNGADEIFGGYYGYNRLKRISDFSRFSNPLVSKINSSFVKTAADFAAFSRWKYKKRLFKGDLRNFEIGKYSRDLLVKAMDKVHFNNVLDDKLFMDLFTICNHSISSIPDTGSMANSKEVRSPFLHHKIIEFGATLPLKFKVKSAGDNTYNKYIVKELACDYFDKNIIYARKYGFGYFISTYDLMRTLWKDITEDIIFSNEIKSLDIFSIEYVKDLWKRFINKKEREGEKLLLARYVMFCFWYVYSF